MSFVIGKRQNLSAAERADLLLNNSGLRHVNAWTLPNDDVPSDDDKLSQEFRENISGLLDVTDIAIKRITDKI